MTRIVAKQLNAFAVDEPRAAARYGGDLQIGASFGVAIVAVVLESQLGHGATSAFQGAFRGAIGITIAAAIPATALPISRRRQEKTDTSSRHEAASAATV